MPGIKTVTMTHFRGATGTTEVDLGGAPLVVVHGANGTGKSTIADAINLICNRTGGSLKGRSSTTLNTDVPAAGWAGKTGVSVSVTDGNGTWKWAGAFDRQGIGAVAPTSPGPPALFVLRRSNLLKLTEAAPAQRYAELGRLIDIPNVEANENAVAAIRTSATRTLTQAKAVYDARHADLNNLWIAAGSPAPDAETWAGNASVIDENSHAMLKRLLELITGHASVGTSLEALGEVVTTERNAAHTVAECQKALIDYMAQAGLTQSDLVTLAVLIATASYLETAAATSTCPTCLQPVGLDTLRTEVAERLKGLSHLKDLDHALHVAQASLVQAQAETAKRRKDLIAKGRAIICIAQASRIEAVEWLGVQWDQYALASAPDGADGENLIQDVKDLYVVFARVYQGATPHLIGLPVIEGLKTSWKILAERIQLAENIKSALTKLRDAEEALDIAQRQVDAWTSVSEIVKEQRQNFVKALLQTVMEDCSTLYSQIHPGEAIRLTNVEMGGAGAGRSLEMTADLAGHQGTPQAYLSDSHLDTLGFCFWLAAVKHYSHGNAIVLLDDVFSSADAEHQDRILHLLRKQTTPGRNGPAQIILLTHSNDWRDAARIEANIDRSEVKLIELSPWSYAEGVHA